MPKRKPPVKLGWASTRVPERVMNEIRQIILSEGYKDVADYVRDVIRKDFRERGITFKVEKEKKLKG